MSHPTNTNSDYVCSLPITTKRFTEKTNFFYKEYTIVRRSCYTSSEKDKNSIIEKTIEAKKIAYHPRWQLFFIIIIILCLLNILIFFKNKSIPSDNNDAVETTLSNEKVFNNTEDILDYIISNIPLENGMIFPNSSLTIISNEEIEELLTSYDPLISAILIRMAVNEIYARYGYPFKVSPWEDYYKAQTWYKPDTQHKIDFSSFNQTEVSNLKKFLEIEKKLHY